MLKNIRDFLISNAKIEAFMSIILLVAVTAISCNMDSVVEKRSEVPTEIKWNGKSVVIDPGHGGADPGKVGENKVKEKDVNLEISKALQRILEKKGFQVVMTRSSDIALSEGIKFSKIDDLNKRCTIINNTYAANSNCVMISIHQNSFVKQSVHGAQCFYYQRSPDSKRLGELIQNKLNEKINTEKPKQAKPNDSYYMLINSKCPGIIIECGFLSNPDDANKLTDAEYQRKMAEIIVSCLNEYFNVK